MKFIDKHGDQYAVIMTQEEIDFIRKVCWVTSTDDLPGATRQEKADFAHGITKRASLSLWGGDLEWVAQCSESPCDWVKVGRVIFGRPKP